jgi:hypothetical protein
LGGLERLSAALGSLDLKCSKSPKEQNLYRAFAALRELRAARRRFGLVFILNAVNLLKNEAFYWAFAALEELRAAQVPL